MNARQKTILVAAVLGLVVSISVGYIIGTGLVGPRIEENRPAEVYGSVSVTRWDKPAPVFTVNSTKGVITFPVKGKVNVITPQYVRCPDICHLESQMMVYAMEKLKEEGLLDQVVFITIDVDPWNGTLDMARDYQRRVAKDLLDDVEWIWVLDSVEKMQEIYKAYDIYVERVKHGTVYLVNHFGGFFIIDKDGTLRYIVHPDWNKIYDTAVVLHDKIVEVIKEG